MLVNLMIHSQPQDQQLAMTRRLNVYQVHDQASTTTIQKKGDQDHTANAVRFLKVIKID